MIALTLLLQLAAFSEADSRYSAPALRDFVARAAVANQAPPLQLQGYTARLESELALIMRDTLGREELGQVEQLAARADWTRDGQYRVHVVGYRSLMGIMYSALTFTRMYSVPTLFGNRLTFGINDGIPRTRKDSLHRAVHPLAADRDKYYRFRGGDTVATLNSQRRTIRLVRVYADPIEDPGLSYTGLRGELDFDADRHQLVRMRGRLERHTTRKDPLIVRAMGITAVAYVELENAEVDGKYWLPWVQRSEFQAQTGLMVPMRPIYRMVTRFRDHRFHESVVTADHDSGDVPSTRAKLIFAGGDSVSRFGEWDAELGAQSGSVHGDDFQDLAPDAWRATGAPRVSFWPRWMDDVIRYNRIEGLFTGVSASVDFRDAFPGLSARATAGFGWSERSPRGSAVLSLTRGQWTNTVRLERALATTNDFAEMLDHDYVDRYSASWLVSRLFGRVGRGLVASELAYVAERYPRATVSEPPWGGEPFRLNRFVMEGDYLRGTAILELNPRVNGQTLTPGVGARVRYQLATGDLDWQRVDVRLAARQYWRGLQFSTRLDGGAVMGRVIPPQALYEIGGGLELPSYEYKEFGGDRAAVGRALAAYHFPVLRKPRRAFKLMVPGLSPGIGVGVQGGWTEASSPAARAALLGLGGDGVTPLSRPTGTIRSTIDARLTLLSGVIGVGIARPLDQAGEWRPFLGGGAAF